MFHAVEVTGGGVQHEGIILYRSLIGASLNKPSNRSNPYACSTHYNIIRLLYSSNLDICQFYLVDHLPQDKQHHCKIHIILFEICTLKYILNNTQYNILSTVL